MHIHIAPGFSPAGELGIAGGRGLGVVSDTTWCPSHIRVKLVMKALGEGGALR